MHTDLVLVKLGRCVELRLIETQLSMSKLIWNLLYNWVIIDLRVYLDNILCSHAYCNVLFVMLLERCMIKF